MLCMDWSANTTEMQHALQHLCKFPEHIACRHLARLGKIKRSFSWLVGNKLHSAEERLIMTK